MVGRPFFSIGWYRNREADRAHDVDERFQWPSVLDADRVSPEEVYPGEISAVLKDEYGVETTIEEICTLGKRLDPWTSLNVEDVTQVVAEHPAGNLTARYNPRWLAYELDDAPTEQEQDALDYLFDQYTLEKEYYLDMWV